MERKKVKFTIGDLRESAIGRVVNIVKGMGVELASPTIISYSQEERPNVGRIRPESFDWRVFAAWYGVAWVKEHHYREKPSLHPSSATSFPTRDQTGIPVPCEDVA